MKEVRFRLRDNISGNIFKSIRELTFTPSGKPWSARVQVDSNSSIWLFDFELIQYLGEGEATKLSLLTEEKA